MTSRELGICGGLARISVVSLLFACGACANAVGMDDTGAQPPANEPGYQAAPPPVLGNQGDDSTGMPETSGSGGAAGAGGEAGAAGAGGQGGAPTVGLSAYYDFETNSGAVSDESGHGNDGMALGSGVAFVSGKNGKGASFSGGDGRIVIPANASLDFSSAATIELWVRLSGVSSGTILSRGIGSGDSQVRIKTNLGNIQVVFSRASQASAILTSDYDVIGSGWSHVAVVNDGSELSLYVNGKLSSSVAGGALGPLVSNLHIGKSEGPEPAFNGVVDEVKWWTVARTVDEICIDAGGTYAEATGCSL
ncbi:MAG: LamG domain-containing protein [Polyangiaceae bacterium]|nr:LamG domain-containing protein [Polyangiaceae bacterium]